MDKTKKTSFIMIIVAALIIVMGIILLAVRNIRNKAEEISESSLVPIVVTDEAGQTRIIYIEASATDPVTGNTLYPLSTSDYYPQGGNEDINTGSSGSIGTGMPDAAPAASSPANVQGEGGNGPEIVIYDSSSEGSDQTPQTEPAATTTSPSGVSATDSSDVIELPYIPD